METPPRRGKELKLYRIEDNEFIHERDFIIGGDAIGPHLASSQLYGDTLVFIDYAGENRFQFRFYSIVDETQLYSTTYNASWSSYINFEWNEV